MSSENISENKFINEKKLFRLIPNFEENEKYADYLLNEIKTKFIYAMKENQFYDDFNYSLKLLRRYVNTYSLRFTKTEYVSIIELLYHVLVQKDIDAVITLNVLTELKSLLKKMKYLSREDLTLAWEPLYDIMYHHIHSSKAKNGILCSPKPIKDILFEVIRSFSCFFSEESTRDIWLLARPYLHYPYPLYPNKHNGLKILKLLLPFYFNNKEYFFDFIWPHLLKMMSTITWTSKCENDLMILLGRAASTYVGMIDWTPYLDQLFTALLRSLKIKVSGCSKKTKFNSSKVYVDILVYAIYGSADCEPIQKFRQLFQAINHLFHPSSHNNHTGKLLNLIYQISSALLTRYQNERVKKPKHKSFGNYPKEFHISDDHINNMVKIMLPSCEFSIFTKAKSEFGSILWSVQKLSCLCPEIMIPACLKLFHETSETVLEPHRALSTLAIVSMLHIPLLTSVDRYPEGKLAVFPLMRQLITYININDPPKSYISIICFGNLANILWMEDLSDKAFDKGLTSFEKEVSLATTQFEDLVLQFFDKLFEIIDIGFSESEMVESQRNSDFRTEMLIDSLIMVIPNISDVISQQVLDKTIDFVFSHSFLSESIQHFFGAIFACLLERDTIAENGFQRFIPHYMRYFHGLVQDDCIMIHEKIDFKFVWLSNLLPGFIKTKLLPNIVDHIMEVLLTLSKIHTFDSYKIIDLLSTYSLNQCTNQVITLRVIRQFRDVDFHLNSWSGIITRSELCHDSRYRMDYSNPDEIGKKFTKRIISEVISPILNRLTTITNIIKNKKEEKIENKELRSICNVLLTICECNIEYLLEEDEVTTPYIFSSEDGPLPVLSKSSPPPRILGVSVFSNPSSSVSILQDIKSAAREALSVVFTSIAFQDNLSRFPIPSSDVEHLFTLIQRIHDLRSGPSFNGRKSFLDRRFESFTHPLRHMSNTMLNWVMLIDDLHANRFRLLPEPLTEEVALLADTLFLFLGLPHPTLQRAAIQCLHHLIEGYLQLEEYIVHKILIRVTDKITKIDENLHSGISQLLLKIFENNLCYESLTFLYKFITIFVALGRSPHVDVRNNRNLHSKMFDQLIQLIGSFIISPRDNFAIDFTPIITKLSPMTLVPHKVTKNSVIFEARKKLYYSCLEFSFSCYIDYSAPKEDAPLFARNNLSCSLSSTTTWQSIYQMTLVLPLHVELPIPLTFLELFFLIVFSPSKELSSQGCNQINIAAWLLKQSLSKAYIVPRDLGMQEELLSSIIQPGPRPDNSFLVIEKDTNYWQISSNSRIKDGSNGYLWWPQKIKIRTHQETDMERQISAKQNSDVKCWQLLRNVFGSEDFCLQFETFLLDLGSQFLREEETGQTGSSIVSSIHQFAADHFVNSMFICIGPSKGLLNMRKVYERLVRCTDSNQIYANRMAVQILSGILMSTKYWSMEECSSFFSKDLLSLIDLYLESCCKSEVKLISKCLVDLCVNAVIDVRQLLPVYRHFITLLQYLEHDSTKEETCLYFVRNFAKNCGWKIGESIIEDLCYLWRKFVCNPAEKLRKEAGKIMKFFSILPMLTNQYYFCSPSKQALFQKFPKELIQIFANQTQLVLTMKGLEPSIMTMKALKLTSPLITEPYLDDDDSAESSIQALSETPSLDSPPNEVDNDESAECYAVSADKIVSTMISSLTMVFVELDEFITHDMLNMFFICFDMIPVRDKIHIYTNLRHCAVMVANILLTHDSDVQKDMKIKCSTLFSFLEKSLQHKSWRVRLIAVKMMQIISFNNFFVVSRSENMSRLIIMTFDLIKDTQIEVRKECAVMLSGLIQCSMYQATSVFISDMLLRFNTLEKSKLSPDELVTMHSGVLGLCAFIQAYPFNIPSELPEVLTVLCRYINKPEPICGTIKETLSKFKKSHQDSWHLQRVHFTEDQLCALTDVLVSPSYYA